MFIKYVKPFRNCESMDLWFYHLGSDNAKVKDILWNVYGTLKQTENTNIKALIACLLKLHSDKAMQLQSGYTIY